MPSGPQLSFRTWICACSSLRRVAFCHQGARCRLRHCFPLCLCRSPTGLSVGGQKSRGAADNWCVLCSLGYLDCTAMATSANVQYAMRSPFTAQEGARPDCAYSELLEAAHLVFLLVLHVDVGMRRHVFRRWLVGLCSALPRHIACLGCSPRRFQLVLLSPSSSICGAVCSDWAGSWGGCKGRVESVLVRRGECAVYSQSHGRIMSTVLGASGHVALVRSRQYPLPQPGTTDANCLPFVHHLCSYATLESAFNIHQSVRHVKCIPSMNRRVRRTRL